MYREIITILICLIFFGTGFVSSINIQIKETEKGNRGNTLYVGGSGGGNYTKIQDAIDNASDGDTVFVYDDLSPYYEHVEIDISINLIGEDKNSTIIEYICNKNVINISADGVTVTNFTITNGYYNGIYITSNESKIFNNIFINDTHGIRIIASYHNFIMNNIFFNSNSSNIYLKNSSNNYICYNNILNSTRDGICIDEGRNNSISHNNIFEIRFAIIIHESYNNFIKENIITENDEGILTWGCYDSIIANNIIISNNVNGIVLGDSTDNLVQNNNISNNGQFGISLWSASNNTIKCNNISNNMDYGITIDSLSNKNTIYHNNIIKNTWNAEDEGDNVWDDGKYGNYWSDYKSKYPFARKIWSKGIWNIPYVIPGRYNKDNCPLINQWPKSRTRTITRDKPFSLNFNLLSWFLERFPLLERLLSQGYFYSRFI